MHLFVPERVTAAGNTLRVVYVERATPDGTEALVLTVIGRGGDLAMMRFEYSADENLLYVALGEGPAAETLEVAESVYVDLDADGRPLGIEFLNADDFLPFLARQGGQLALPERIEDGGIALAS